MSSYCGGSTCGAGFFTGRTAAALVLSALFSIYVVRVGLIGDKLHEGYKRTTGVSVQYDKHTNAVTDNFSFFAQLGMVIGLGQCVFGVLALFANDAFLEWAGIGGGLFCLGVDVLALGFGAKQTQRGSVVGGSMDKQWNAIFAVVVVAVFLQLVRLFQVWWAAATPKSSTAPKSYSETLGFIFGGNVELFLIGGLYLTRLGISISWWNDLVEQSVKISRASTNEESLNLYLTTILAASVGCVFALLAKLHLMYHTVATRALMLLFGLCLFGIDSATIAHSFESWRLGDRATGGPVAARDMSLQVLNIVNWIVTLIVLFKLFVNASSKGLAAASHDCQCGPAWWSSWIVVFISILVFAIHGVRAGILANFWNEVYTGNAKAKDSNSGTNIANIFGEISIAVGLGAAIAVFVHGLTWSTGSQVAAVAAIAWSFGWTTLSMGFAIKEVIIDRKDKTRELGKKNKTLAALSIVATFFDLLLTIAAIHLTNGQSSVDVDGETAFTGDDESGFTSTEGSTSGPTSDFTSDATSGATSEAGSDAGSGDEGSDAGSDAGSGSAEGSAAGSAAGSAGESA